MSEPWFANTGTGTDTDKVADIEVDMVADMDVDLVDDMEVDMVADMEVDMVGPNFSTRSLRIFALQ